MKIIIQAGGIRAEAELLDAPTAKALYDALPIESSFHVWGDEIYFTIDVPCEEKAQRDILEIGELALWPPGNAFCIFYGPTPASTDGRPRAADNIVPLGKIIGDATVFRGVNANTISITKAKME